MPGSSNSSSFIPKRGTSKAKRKARKGGIYLLSILSNVALLSSLVASAGVYFYSGSVEKELDAEILAFNNEANNFKEADLKRVQDFDTRLDQAAERLENSVSIASIFSAIESSTAETVRFKSFTLERNFDEHFIIEAEIQTDNFDSTIFQRGAFKDSQIVEAIEVEEVSLQQEVDEEEETVKEGVNFQLFISVPITAVGFDPAPAANVTEEFVTEPTEAEPAGATSETVPESEVEASENNEDNQPAS